jgi:hypothetical protein
LCQIKPQIEINWKCRHTDIYKEDEEQFKKEYNKGWQLENSRFVKVGIFDDMKKVKKYTNHALKTLHNIRLALEYKYDDPEDPEVPHLNPSDPFVILHSSIKYADRFKRIT